MAGTSNSNKQVSDLEKAIKVLIREETFYTNDLGQPKRIFQKRY